MAAQSSPFTQAVVKAIRTVYPEKLADSSFDNTGLLLEAPHRPDNGLKSSVLLTVDLTTAVADEAIQRKDSVIIAYHPIIFRGLKSFTLANTQQASLLRLAQEGISVYCPHTAVDAAAGGLGDWLADIVTSQGKVQHERSIINPINGSADTGSGRVVKFPSPRKLGELISEINVGLGDLAGLSVAVPQNVEKGKKADIEIRSIGICAGSGGSMLLPLDVDMLFTGELSHHEALAVIEKGNVVVTAFHSNSERRFLQDRMLGLVERKVKEIMGNFGGLNPKALKVAVSEADRDPFEILVNGAEKDGW